VRDDHVLALVDLHFDRVAPQEECVIALPSLERDEPDLVSLAVQPGFTVRRDIGGRVSGPDIDDVSSKDGFLLGDTLGEEEPGRRPRRLVLRLDENLVTDDNHLTRHLCLVHPLTFAEGPRDGGPPEIWRGSLDHANGPHLRRFPGVPPFGMLEV
jgi:hypothetical protein